jgi:quinolinate synthase
MQDGNCVVHDMFGHEVVEKIKDQYCDAFLTAHFEVPGEMFSLAIEAKKRGMGVVGSTQNILDFIKDHLKGALDRNVDEHLQFVLGTESEMITSIVAAVRELFDSYSSSQESANIQVEIVFPVSSDAVSKTSIKGSHHLSPSIANDLENLTVVPGVTSAEGCSIRGGCASCPYMKVCVFLFLVIIGNLIHYSTYNYVQLRCICYDGFVATQKEIVSETITNARD